MSKLHKTTMESMMRQQLAAAEMEKNLVMWLLALGYKVYMIHGEIVAERRI